MINYASHKTIGMKGHPEFTERWLQHRISEDPSILGLGDLSVRDQERRQPRGGRLDMLLEDIDGTRYEVELQLGPTDETHIVRTIEYWDVERKRYPQYDHVAVIVAEDITSRFLNVISLFNGSIPVIALQAQAIQVGEQVALIFTKVVDLMPIGFEEEDAAAQETVDRSFWLQGRGSEKSLAMVDEVIELARQIDPAFDAKFNKHYVGVARHGVPTNFITMRPRSGHLILEFKNPITDDLTERIQNAGIEPLAKNRWNTYRLPLGSGDISLHRDLLVDLLQLSYEAYNG